MKNETFVIEKLSNVSAEAYLQVIQNRTFADLESGSVLDYVDPEKPEDNGRAIVLVLEDCKFGKLARIIWTDTYEQDYILGITRIDGKQWTLVHR